MGIRENLWKEAKWFATGFVTTQDDSSPPILAIVFSDKKSAEQIFAAWRTELGGVDKEERLRVTIIRDIMEATPYAYRVLIGSNWSKSNQEGVRYGILISRLNVMYPLSNSNLERFLRSYEKFRTYFLMPAITQTASDEPMLLYGYELQKQELNVRRVGNRA